MLNKQNTADFYTLCMDPGNFMPGTLRSRQAANQATFLDYALPRIRQKPRDKNEVAPMLAVRTETFQIWQDSMDGAVPTSPATLPCPAPKVADSLTINGQEWNIRRVENTLCQDGGTGNVWNCTALLSGSA